MIGIECSNCSRMIDIDTQVEPIKVTCYLMMCPINHYITGISCRECQIDAKNNERDKKLNKVLRRTTIERIKQWWNDVNLVNFVNSVL